MIGYKETGGDAGVEVVPAEPADASDAPSAATRKRSNEQMQKQFYQGGIILGEEMDYDVNSSRRQRIAETVSVVNIEQRVDIGKKRGRVEGGGEEASGSGQRERERVDVKRARVTEGGGGMRVGRPMRLAAVTTELQNMYEHVNGGMGRYKQVRWESGRWCVEEVSLGQDGGESPGGEIRRPGHDTIVSWEISDGATVDSVEDEMRRRGAWELEAAAVEAMAARRGYTTGAAWDEGAMIQAMARMDSPTLRWR